MKIHMPVHIISPLAVVGQMDQLTITIMIIDLKSDITIEKVWETTRILGYDSSYPVCRDCYDFCIDSLHTLGNSLLTISWCLVNNIVSKLTSWQREDLFRMVGK